MTMHFYVLFIACTLLYPVAAHMYGYHSFQSAVVERALMFVGLVCIMCVMLQCWFVTALVFALWGEFADHCIHNTHMFPIICNVVDIHLHIYIYTFTHT